MTSATSGRCSFTSSSVSSGSVSADPPSPGRTAELPPQYEGKPPWCSGSRVPEGSESSSDPFPLPVGLWQNCGAWYAWSLVCPSAPQEKLVDKLAAPQLSGSGTFPSDLGIAIRPSDGGPCSTRATSPTEWATASRNGPCALFPDALESPSARCRYHRVSAPTLPSTSVQPRTWFGESSGASTRAHSKTASRSLQHSALREAVFPASGTVSPSLSLPSSASARRRISTRTPSDSRTPTMPSSHPP